MMKEFNSMTSKTATTIADQLIGEFKALIADAEALIEATDGHADDMIKSIRSKALKTLAGAKESVTDFECVITDKAKAVAEGADDFVHHNPWESVGLAAGLGLVIGLFIRRH